MSTPSCLAVEIAVASWRKRNRVSYCILSFRDFFSHDTAISWKKLSLWQLMGKYLLPGEFLPLIFSISDEKMSDQTVEPDNNWILLLVGLLPGRLAGVCRRLVPPDNGEPNRLITAHEPTRNSRNWTKCRLVKAVSCWFTINHEKTRIENQEMKTNSFSFSVLLFLLLSG